MFMLLIASLFISASTVFKTHDSYGDEISLIFMRQSHGLCFYESKTGGWPKKRYVQVNRGGCLNEGRSVVPYYGRRVADSDLKWIFEIDSFSYPRCASGVRLGFNSIKYIEKRLGNYFVVINVDDIFYEIKIKFNNQGGSLFGCSSWQ